jgi:hypothetical protein
MRLLHSHTLQLHEFIGSDIPYYAILSHRWEHDEVTYADMREGGFESKAGFDKIKKCCAQASKEDLEYIWIDTCCIDKSSSAELTEAINSMYKWYQRAVICYAYLSDVVPTVEPDYRNSGDDWIKNTNVTKKQFTSSQWFTRGWTLQELIAPSLVFFFTNGHDGWVRTGGKSSFTALIESRTGIPAAILRGHQSVQDCSVAMRMSWAAQRTTTREEDMAYCLLGLFDVNMPLLYGEGNSAFVRLQEEIMKQSDDQSLFAWEIDSAAGLSNLFGLLASSPAQFTNSASIFTFPDVKSQVPFQMTNRGLRIELPIVESDGQGCIAVLQCARQGFYLEQIALPLLRLSEHSNYYSRNGNRNSGQLLSVGKDVISKAIKSVVFVRPPWQERSTTFDWQDAVLVRLEREHSDTRLASHAHERHQLYDYSHGIKALPSSADQTVEYFIMPPPQRRGFLLFTNSSKAQIGIFFQTGTKDSFRLSCKVLVGTDDIETDPTFVRFKENVGLSTQSSLGFKWIHDFVATCSSAAFQYLSNDKSVFVEMTPNWIGDKQIALLDIKFQNRCHCCHGDDWGHVWRSINQPYELDASETEISRNNTDIEEEYIDPPTSKILQLKGLMNTLRPRPKTRSKVSLKEPLVDLSSLE